MNGVVTVQIDFPQPQGRVEFCDKRLLRQEALADEVVGLCGILEVGIAIWVPHDLAALRTGEINLDAALGEMPIRMRKLRQSKRGLGIGKYEEYSHR